MAKCPMELHNTHKTSAVFVTTSGIWCKGVCIRHSIDLDQLRSQEAYFQKYIITIGQGIEGELGR